MNILAMGSHPDDIEYGCGGLLLQAVEQGHDVFLHVLTDGGAHPGLDRRAEQAAAARFLGARDLFWGGFADTCLAPGRDLITRIEDVIRKVKPDLVLVNAPDDAHQDHKALASCAVTACRYQTRVLFYHDYTSLKFVPDCFADITLYLDRKRELLACHRSQVEKDYPTHLDLLESVTALAAYYGFMAKVKYAEGYLPLRYLLDLHAPI